MNCTCKQVDSSSLRAKKSGEQMVPIISEAMCHHVAMIVVTGFAQPGKVDKILTLHVY